MNNKGWSLRFMLFLTSLLILLLLIASFFVVKLSRSFSKESNNKTTNSQKIQQTSNNYKEIEDYMDKITLNYIKNEYNNDIGLATTTVNLSTLINYDKQNKLSELLYGKKCVGYTNVFEEKDQFNVSSYLKCDKYSTDGFSNIYLE